MRKYIAFIFVLYFKVAFSQAVEFSEGTCLFWWLNDAGKIVRKVDGQCLLTSSKTDSIQFNGNFYFRTRDAGSYLYPSKNYVIWGDQEVYLLRTGFRISKVVRDDPYLFHSKLFDFKVEVGESWLVHDSISSYTEEYSLVYKEFDKKRVDSLFYFSYRPSQDENYGSEFLGRISLYIVSKQGDKMSVVYCHKGLPNILVSSSRSMMKYTFKRLSIIRKWCR